MPFPIRANARSCGKHFAGAIASLALAVSAASPGFALENPIVVNIEPVGSDGGQGSVSFFQLGKDVIVNVTFTRDPNAIEAIGINPGTCAQHAPDAQWYVADANGKSQSSRLPNVQLSQLLRHAFVIHKTNDHGSPTVGCADIRNTS